ncbi:MAG: hypothetical protein PF904_12015 [Kiritimatiellae bacterium]|jgi:hypothetical protein|nr:hypothetical protein [Kiritimatiellia bacterium]
MKTDLNRREWLRRTGLLMVGLFCVAVLSFTAMGAQSAAADQDAYVDQQGGLRWRGSNDEVALFGVNYYTPFTVDYAEVRKLGGDHRQTILDDVAHLRRLGLGCIRVHCFDREFSDAEGNLIDNHHVELQHFRLSAVQIRRIFRRWPRKMLLSTAIPPRPNRQYRKS